MNAFRSLRRLFALLVCGGALFLAPVALVAAGHAEAPADAHAAPAASAPAASHGHDHSHAGADPTVLQMFAYSYLAAFMFCLSLAMAGLVFVILHHLFDAGWSASMLRLAEHLACLIKPLFLALFPLLLLQNQIWPWLHVDPANDHALQVKAVIFNRVMFNGILIAIFALWTWMATTFRRYSLAQDKDGAAIWTRKARFLAGWGIFAFAFSLTLGVILLMMSLQWQFFSTIYGVYYFAGSVWVTLATLYGLIRWLGTRELKPVIFPRQVHDLSVLFFAFTVFFAYIGFSQYFLIWNAAIPEETFWYVNREKGSWWEVGLLLLFGHFFLPFLVLLRIDTKMSLAVMAPMIAWAWLMHYLDMTFNIMPVLYPDGLHLTIFDPLCWFGLVAVLAWFFWRDFQKYPKWPQKHPRLQEAVTHHEIPPAPYAADEA
ncbi:MAG: hypothetical protein KIT22_00160 [Verrucomicrobiae bacterium]|nr:hypothetical protein [Verrucomicrobiae bacterium]